MVVSLPNCSVLTVLAWFLAVQAFIFLKPLTASSHEPAVRDNLTRLIRLNPNGGLKFKSFIA